MDGEGFFSSLVYCVAVAVVHCDCARCMKENVPEYEKRTLRSVEARRLPFLSSVHLDIIMVR